MPDGSIYDGRYQLIHDIEWARISGYDVDDPNSMADFYGVTRSEYETGEKWYSENLM